MPSFPVSQQLRRNTNGLFHVACSQEHRAQILDMACWSLSIRLASFNTRLNSPSSKALSAARATPAHPPPLVLQVSLPTQPLLLISRLRGQRIFLSAPTHQFPCHTTTPLPIAPLLLARLSTLLQSRPRQPIPRQHHPPLLSQVQAPSTALLQESAEAQPLC